MASPKKKHVKNALHVETPDNVFSKKKKKKDKNKESPGLNFVDDVIPKRKEEAFAASETPKKKKKSKAHKEEAPDPIVAQSAKRWPSVEALPEIVKSPSKKRSRVEKESEFLQSPLKKLKRSEESGKSSLFPVENAERKEKKNSDFWPQEDLQMLYSRMRDALPKDDKLTFHTRQEKLDWNSVSFGNYSGEDCKKMWLQVTRSLRGYRLLSEMITDAEAVVEKPWFKFGKKESKQKHPDEPNKPLGAYMLYYLAVKGKITADNPGLGMGPLTKMIAAKYKALSPAERKKYDDLAAEQKKEYLEKWKIFQKSHPESVVKKAAAPKKSRTPAQIFTEERTNKLANSGLSAQEIKEHVKDKWKKLSDKKRIKWIKKAADEHRAFVEDHKEDLASNPDAKKITVLSRKELELLLKDAGKPVKPPSGPMRIFIRDEFAAERDKETSSSNEDIFRALNVRWKEMSSKEKQPYVERLCKEMDQYRKDYEAYLEALTDEQREYETIIAQNVVPKKKGAKPTEEKEPEKPLFPAEPLKPPGSAFELFVQSFVKESGLPASQAKAYWSHLPDSEKAKFDAKQKTKMEKYMVKFKRFLVSLTKEERKLYKKHYQSEQTEANARNGAQRAAQPAKAQVEESSDSEPDSTDSDSSSIGEKEAGKKEEDSGSEEEEEESQEEERVPNSGVVITKPAAASSDSDSAESESD